MKKLVLLLAVVFSVSLFSCGNKAEEATTEATDAVEAVEAVEVTEEAPCCNADSCTADSCCQAAAEVVEAVAE